MNSVLIVGAIFLLSAGVFSLWERLQPWRGFSYRPLLRRDIGALLVVAWITVLVELIVSPCQKGIESLSYWVVGETPAELDWGVLSRVGLFYILWDFSLYWFHRLMHRSPLWAAHKWHHVPTHIWWLAGIRASLVHTLLFQIAFFWFWVLQLPYWMSAFLAGEFLVRNGWMHLNVRFRWARQLEYLIVTPRYHAIHHSDNPQLYRCNLGSLLTVWDRLFGTYVNPDRVEIDSLAFGIKERTHPVRLAIGI